MITDPNESTLPSQKSMDGRLKFYSLRKSIFDIMGPKPPVWLAFVSPAIMDWTTPLCKAKRDLLMRLWEMGKCGGSESGSD